MGDIFSLISDLKRAGFAISKPLEKAMQKVSISDFSDYDCTEFYHDRPVLFIETNQGGSKTISAPHMIVTLIENLELNSGDKVLIFGGKGGYIAALIAHIIGEKGKVTIIDPNQEIVDYIKIKLAMYPTVDCFTVDDFQEINDSEGATRILITGQIENIPDWLTARINVGGFVIAPIGNTVKQNLLKIENQDNEFFETDLGSVVFGPLNIEDSVVQIPSPEELASMIENMVETLFDIGIILDKERNQMYDLVAELRQLPDDLTPPNELEDPMESPMVKLLMETSEIYERIWPFIFASLQDEIASYSGDTDYSSSTPHRDFTP